MNLASFVDGEWQYCIQMKYQTEYRVARGAVSALLLMAGAMVFESFANPVLIQEVETSQSAPGDESSTEVTLRPARRAVADELSAHPLPVTIDEIRVGEGAPGRRPGWDGNVLDLPGASPRLSGNYGGVFGQGEALRDQLLREFGAAGGNPAGEQAGGADLLRRAGAQNPANPAQAMMQEAVDNALGLIRDSVVGENDMVSFSVVGIDFNLALAGGRRGLIVSSELLPTILQVPLGEEARSEASVRTSAQAQAAAAGFAGGDAKLSDSQPGVGPVHPVALIIEKIREFATEPTTIAVALGCLFIWLSYEITSAIRERRRARRERRREAAARG